MTDAGPVPIGALLTHARDVPARDRSSFADAAHELLGDRAFVLQTCHRVEVYVPSIDDGRELLPMLPAGGRALSGERAVRHAMSVSVGGDSVVVGEDQILHQFRIAVDAARASGNLDPALERLFMTALQAGRRARSWQQGPHRSLADVALAAIERLAGPIAGRPVLVVGAGAMGRIAARTAVAAGAHVSVTSRSASSAGALAAATGAATVVFDPSERIGSFAGVIVALGGPWPISTSTVEALATRRVAIVDLSVPVAVPDTVGRAVGKWLVTADDLAAVETVASMTHSEMDRLDALAAAATADFLTWLSRRDGREAAAALVERADLERREELASLWRRLPDLEPDVRGAIEDMTRHLAERLLRAPLERLGRDSEGDQGRAVRDLFAL
ncbi:MAG TPA: NAD(P)-binding domain-containing protein [Candidatus Dormibacteraeota bacterium]|nr:NAD(P)-binding domain-containing protein [Candidatus Dormibacteraeota bacterium]